MERQEIKDEIVSQLNDHHYIQAGCIRDAQQEGRAEPAYAHESLYAILLRLEDTGMFSEQHAQDEKLEEAEGLLDEIVEAGRLEKYRQTEDSDNSRHHVVCYRVDTEMVDAPEWTKIKVCDR